MIRAVILFTVITTLLLIQPAVANKKRFIFRQDDVEDWFNSATQVSLLNFFMDRGLGVSAGIIANYFSGADTNLYNTLRRCVSLGYDKCALMNHGLDALYQFGNAPTVRDARRIIRESHEKIEKLFNNYEATVFVPHQNSWNENTLQALRDLKYDAISASTESYSGMTWDLTGKLLQMPQQTTTGIYTSSGEWVANPVDSVVHECSAAASRDEVCVIMIHPHEFANGQYNLHMLQDLVNKLHAAGFESTNFQTVINESKGITKAPSRRPTVQPSFAPTRPQPTLRPSTAPVKRFIFRQDDVEDWYNNHIQAGLLNFFMDRGIGISAGIIGDYVSGNDKLIYDVLKRCVALGPDKCALINHGKDDKFRFGDNRWVLTQLFQMLQCDLKIKRLFRGYKSEIFVPHQNSWNSQTLLAARLLGYDAISASILPYSGMEWDLTSNPIQMPEQTTTGLYTEFGTWAPNPIENIIHDCNAAAARDEVCVIMIHPHEFANGVYTMEMLEHLVDALLHDGFTSTNFPTVIAEAKRRRSRIHSESLALPSTESEATQYLRVRKEPN